MEVSMASMSTAANGLKPEIRLPLSDILLLTVVVEDRLEIEAGEEDLGVLISEFELLKL
jgi:hypothetical protein